MIKFFNGGKHLVPDLMEYGVVGLEHLMLT